MIGIRLLSAEILRSDLKRSGHIDSRMIFVKETHRLRSLNAANMDLNTRRGEGDVFRGLYPLYMVGFSDPVATVGTTNSKVGSLVAFRTTQREDL